MGTKKVAQAKHGGSRAGSGRPRELVDGRPVLVILESDQVESLDRYSKDNKLRGRSAVLRLILDKFFKIIRG